MKVCHITSVHKWNDVRIFEKECVSLAKEGFDVSLVSVNGHEGIFKGVNVYSVKSRKSGRFYRMTKTVYDVYLKAKSLNADIYHIHDPELIPVAIKFFKSGKIVFYDAHEDLNLQVKSKHYIPKIFRNTISFITEIVLKVLSKNCSAVVAATPSIYDYFTKQGANSIVLFNFPIISELYIDFKDKKSDEFSICYAGGIMESRGIFQLLDAMNGSPFKLHLAGNYSPASLRSELVSKPSWSNVIEYGFLNRKEILEMYKKCNVGIVTLLPAPNYIDAYPVKMFEYMAAGLAIIASDFPLYKSIIEENNCGICLDPTNPQKINEAIFYLSQNKDLVKAMSLNGQRLISSKYNWDVESLKLINLYNNYKKD